jgi:hypothetical protein
VLRNGSPANEANGLKCPNHPHEEATYCCDNCGKPYCERCVNELGYDRVFCAETELFVADLIDLI